MKTFSVTDVGKKRQMNQDYVFCSENPVGILPNLFLVADGMGGHNAGDFASRFAVEEFVMQMKDGKERTVIHSMDEAIRKTNTKLIQAAKEHPELSGMGTTFVAATVTDEGMYIANVGDSRLYLIDDDSITQITQDHSLVEEMIRRGELERGEARFHPNKNVITRALGANVDIVPDFFEVKPRHEDIVLMCSDGLSNMMDDAEILSIIQENRPDLERAGTQLLKMANEYGGKDNITILLLSEFEDSSKINPDVEEMR